MSITIDEILKEFELLIGNYVRENTILNIQVKKLLNENDELKSKLNNCICDNKERSKEMN